MSGMPAPSCNVQDLRSPSSTPTASRSPTRRLRPHARHQGHGGRQCPCRPSRTFARRDVFLRAASLYQDRHADHEMRIPATFDIVYLTAWAPDTSQQQPLRPGSGNISLTQVLQDPDRDSPVMKGEDRMAGAALHQRPRSSPINDDLCCSPWRLRAPVRGGGGGGGATTRALSPPYTGSVAETSSGVSSGAANGSITRTSPNIWSCCRFPVSITEEAHDCAAATMSASHHDTAYRSRVARSRITGRRSRTDPLRLAYVERGLQLARERRDPEAPGS